MHVVILPGGTVTHLAWESVTSLWTACGKFVGHDLLAYQQVTSVAECDPPFCQKCARHLATIHVDESDAGQLAQ